MPSSSTPPSSDLHTRVVRRATDLPPYAWSALTSNEVNANVILPILMKCFHRDQQNQSPNNHLWITVYTRRSRDHRDVKLIASVTEGTTGSYPVFLFTPVPSQDLEHDHAIFYSIQSVVKELLNVVPPSRVFSVFGPQLLAKTFASLWYSATRIEVIQDPYYLAKISFLTAQTFVPTGKPLPCHMSGATRLATPHDADRVAQLCWMFARESPPFELERAGAEHEARALIQNRQVWVHTLSINGSPEHIASICAITRSSENVATITKVYTDPEVRGAGCAERLVRVVCGHLLRYERKQQVALFVGIGNRAANVYQRVGFVGVGERAQPAPGVDTWVELGFDRSQVELGHW